MARQREDILHPGELDAQQRFGSDRRWPSPAIDAMMAPLISPGLAAFLEAQQFFFIATADAEGNCDASFRGAERNASGQLLPALRVLDPQRLVFPDYAGNGLFNSLGNLLVNPHIGMVFVDFGRQLRARVNGRAEILPVDALLHEQWPMAERLVLVTVEQAYGNCRARIPRLVPASEAGEDAA
ncbi:MAG TPA: pyridoxamine 5'-phosphate oxidase family protein [Azospirillaceae bacterium]|nr:pyridoxamine 5'-phosphate oxidase family protein [Azospirillaceae bacterium]